MGVVIAFAGIAFGIGAALLSLVLFYGIVVIIFRYAFGVELWNPFH